MLEWARWMEEEDNLIKKTTIANEIVISTIFLGLDHSFGKGDPILFETMVSGGKYDQYQERYCTIDTAEEGHRKVVEMIREEI